MTSSHSSGFLADWRVNTDRCLALARATNAASIRKSLIKIADGHSALADWIAGEITAGRRRVTDL